MNLICLNTWGGRAGKEKLLNFFERNRSTDIFCLQEIWSAPYEHLDGNMAGGLTIDHSVIMTNGLQDISALLNDHNSYFRPHHGDHYGLFILLKKGIKLIEEGELFVHKHKGYKPEGDVGRHARNIQYITVQTEKGLRTIINFHGLWNGGGKTDSEERLQQSQKIIDFLKTVKNPYVICGDFNLLPDTQSIKMLEDFDLRNLIKEFNIKSTRTPIYERPQRFADYIFLSPEISLKKFEVMSDIVSDHHPLYLKFE